MRPLPVPAALAVVVLGGVASAAQGVVNAELGERAGDPLVGAMVNNLGGCLIVLLGLVAVPSMRAGLAGLRHSGLPWWAYLGGLGGAAIVVIGPFVVPALGVAVFTIAQVAGGSLGGLAVDRVGLAATGRLALTLPRVVGALLGIAAVTMAQLGRPVGDLAVGLVLLSVAGGLAVALQSALNGRVAAAIGPAAGLAVNFAVSTSVIAAVAALAGALATRPAWPTQWWLYVGGLFGVGIVLALLVGVRAAGVLRTGLALVAGQLGGALVLDVAVPGGAGVRLPVLAGAVLTGAAVVVAGGRRRRPVRVAAEPEPEPDGRLVP
ncbi:DMT family transporter [Micromonospora halotolerans]|uniref:DMT family transporter n=1 Tax=Micromonospora halotolerans TaxID=709879 RepID=A0ABY9ZWZ1_9ACTN|nr:DMT family transporter [Micromonospora halotolerans]WNM39811.1 DMT family transporter [Micromonospora halotolerans]